MTFGDLVALVRREIIVDAFDDAFLDGDIYEALWRASVETAAAFDIPRDIITASVAVGATSITVPATVRRVHTLTIAGDDLRSVDVQELLRMRPGGPRVPRYFNFDPRRLTALLIAPAAARAGTATIEVTQGLVQPVDLEDVEPWAGALPQFHSLVAYRAAVVLYQMDERQEETAFWINEYQTRASELAAFLGRTDLANLVVEAGLRNDKGADG